MLKKAYQTRSLFLLLVPVVFLLQTTSGQNNREPNMTYNVTPHGNGTLRVHTSLWGWWIKQTLTPVVVVVGIIGNCLSIIVMTSKNLRRKSYSQFLSALAVFDSLSLVWTQVELIDQLLQYHDSYSMFNTFSSLGCKIYQFITCSCFVMSAWLVVALAIERVIAIYFPFKKATLCRPFAAFGIIISILVISMHTQVFRLVMIEHVDGMCRAADDYSSLFISLHTYFYVGILVDAVPILAISVANSLILWKISQVQGDMQDENSATNRAYRSNRRQSKTTRMLLAITFTYIVLTLPTFFVSIAVITAMNRQPPKNIILFSRLQPYGHFSDFLSAMNYAVNFFIYVLTGHKFRSELRYFFKSRLSSIRRSGSHPGTRVTLLKGRRSYTVGNCAV